MDVRPGTVAGAALLFLISCGWAGDPPAPISYSIYDRIGDARPSHYTDRILELVRDWPPKDMPVPADEAHPVCIEGIRTPGNSSYIGLRKAVLIHAPAARVQEVFENFSEYHKVFPGVVKVEMQREANRISTRWERESPAFFIPNVRYEQIYVTEELAGRRFYRYQLKTGNSLNYADGVVVIEPKGADTVVSSYDFFEGNFGIAKLFAEGKIWCDTLEGFERADLVLKAKAENPDWKKERIEAQVEQYLKKNPVKLQEIRFFSQLEPAEASEQRVPAANLPETNR